MDELVDKKVIRIYCEQIQKQGGEDDEAAGPDEGMKQLENKLEKIMWKMNIFIACVAIVVLAVVVKHVANV